tara:strand:- start:490 stop:822 length:333 start_codon:yes stop_codon:yes gene_type:complete
MHDIMEVVQRGLIFGIVDNGVLIFGVLWGCTYLEKSIEKSVQRQLSSKMCFFLGATIGGGAGNTASDALGCLMDPTMIDSIIGITIGTQLPIIPFYLIWAYFILKSIQKA